MLAFWPPMKFRLIVSQGHRWFEEWPGTPLTLGKAGSTLKRTELEPAIGQLIQEEPG